MAHEMAATTTTSRVAPTHPLEPLGPDELAAAVAIVRREKSLDARALFETITLREPAKKAVRGFTPGTQFEREAFVVVLDRNAGATFEAVVSLSQNRVTSWTHVPGVQPRILAEEMEEVTRLVKADPRYLEGLRSRGIDDLDKVWLDAFAVGNFGAEEERTLRLIRPHSFYVERPQDNPHVRPIEGLVPVVDMNAMKVLRVEDNGVKPLPGDPGHYSAADQPSLRAPLARLEITQPDGPDFRVEGHKVTWQNWSFRVGFTPREGLVLHTLSFTDGGRDRPVIYRASVSELVVPYAETSGDHYRNHSFDLGESGLGTCVNALKLGCDCVGAIHYFDVHMASARGAVVRYPNAICLHEEDYGVLWKHTHPITRDTAVRRSRRLVVSSFYTVGNYDYGIFWYLYLDGTIQFDAKLTGILYTGAIETGVTPAYGRLVAPNLNAMIHEHYFNLRLDMSVDGDANAVMEVEADLVPTGPGNPHGNAHGARETLIESERSGARDIKPELGRYWKVVNRSRTSAMGWHPGYRLVPGASVKPMHQPGSPFMRRAGFVAHDLWVTAYDPRELYAPGDWVNQGIDGPGLPEWARADRPLVDTDVVLWYTLGVFHLPRPEDFPIMPVEYTGFMLKPTGFFDRNPTLDLPQSHCHASKATARVPAP